MGVDSITWPLNGMGRYALELAKRLPGSDGIEELLFFANGRFVSEKVLAAISQGGTANAAMFGWRLFSAIKRGLRQSNAAAWVHTEILPAIVKRRLRNFSEFLYHSPSYLLPDHGGPAVTTIHDLSIFKFPQWHPEYRVKRLNAAIGKTLDVASHVITDTEEVRREVLDYFALPEEMVTAVPLGVGDSFYPRRDAELALALETFGLKPGEYSLCVASIEPRKNIDRLVGAYANLPVSLQRKYPLVLVGDYGWNSEDIHRLIADCEQRGWLKYLKHVSDSYLPLLYSGCRAFVYPSLYEGFGLPLLEAMACGVPVLTSDCSCMPEVAGDAGMLVDPYDILSVAKGIERILTDDSWRMSAVERGFARAGSMTWDNTVRNTLAVYRKVWDEK